MIYIFKKFAFSSVKIVSITKDICTIINIVHCEHSTADSMHAFVSYITSKSRLKGQVTSAVLHKGYYIG